MCSAGNGGSSGGEAEGELLSPDTEQGGRLSLSPVLLISMSRTDTVYALENQNRGRKPKYGNEAFEIHSQSSPCQPPVPFVISRKGAVVSDL